MPRNLRVEFPGAIYHLAGLNPALPREAITAAVDELTRDRSAMSQVWRGLPKPSRAAYGMRESRR